MVRADKYKLIWYPVGNRKQLFDLENDPREIYDVSGSSGLSSIRDDLMHVVAENCFGTDLKWVKNGTLVGMPEKDFAPSANRGLSDQRGWR